MCYPVCGTMYIKEPLLLIGKSNPCGGSGFPLSLSEWSFTICHGWMDGSVDGWMDGSVNRLMDEWMNGWTEVWMDGWVDRCPQYDFKLII